MGISCISAERPAPADQRPAVPGAEVAARRADKPALASPGTPPQHVGTAAVERRATASVCRLFGWHARALDVKSEREHGLFPVATGDGHEKPKGKVIVVGPETMAAMQKLALTRAKRFAFVSIERGESPADTEEVTDKFASEGKQMAARIHADVVARLKHGGHVPTDNEIALELGAAEEEIRTSMTSGAAPAQRGLSPDFAHEFGAYKRFVEQPKAKAVFDKFVAGRGIPESLHARLHAKAHVEAEETFRRCQEDPREDLYGSIPETRHPRIYKNALIEAWRAIDAATPPAGNEVAEALDVVLLPAEPPQAVAPRAIHSPAPPQSQGALARIDADRPDDDKSALLNDWSAFANYVGTPEGDQVLDAFLDESGIAADVGRGSKGALLRGAALREAIDIYKAAVHHQGDFLHGKPQQERFPAVYWVALENHFAREHGGDRPGEDDIAPAVASAVSQVQAQAQTNEAAGPAVDRGQYDAYLKGDAGQQVFTDFADRHDVLLHDRRALRQQAAKSVPGLMRNLESSYEQILIDSLTIAMAQQQSPTAGSSRH